MRNSHKLNAPLVLAKCGSMYRCYRFSPVTRAWERVIMLQTTLLVATSLFGYSLGEYYQAILLNLTLTVSVVVLIKLRPYQCARLQRLVVAGAACVAFTTYAALSFLSGAAVGMVDSMSPTATAVGNYGREVIGVQVLVVNICITVWGIYELVSALEWEKVKKLVELVVHVSLEVMAALRKFAAKSWEHGVVHLVHYHEDHHEVHLTDSVQRPHVDCVIVEC